METVAGRAEAGRSLEIAARLLAARDLVGSKRFAERALECDPLLDGVDQVLSVADVLLAAQSPLPHDPLALLQIPPSPSPPDPSAVARSYRRLALLLRPDRNRHPGADSAFRLVVDAFSSLSKPSPPPSSSSEPAPAPAPPTAPMNSSSSAAGGSSGDAFWTGCPSCCHLHEYPRKYLNAALRCPVCQSEFSATELPSPPPIVPGTEMYFCSWGFFPLGFPSGPIDAGWKPFVPMDPSLPNAAQNPAFPSNPTPSYPLGKLESSGPPPAAGQKRSKKVAKKKVGGFPMKPVFNPEPVSSKPGAAVGANAAAVAAETTTPEGYVEKWAAAGGVPDFHMDMDSSEDLLNNLHNLPFLN